MSSTTDESHMSDDKWMAEAVAATDIYDELHPIREYEPLEGLWLHPAMQRLAVMQRLEAQKMSSRHAREVIRLSIAIKKREEV